MAENEAWEAARRAALAGRAVAAVEALRVAVLDDAVVAKLLGPPDDAGAWAEPYLDHPHVVLALDADPDLGRAFDRLSSGDARRPLFPGGYAGPHPGTAAFLEGVAASERGDHEAALRFAREAAARLPRVPDARFNEGCALESLGRDAEALAAYRGAVAIAPDFGNGWFNLGLLLRRTSDLPGSREALAKAVEAEPGSSLFRYKHAEALALAGDRAGAVAELERAIGLEEAVRDALGESEVFKVALGKEAVAALSRPPKKPKKR